MLTKEQIKFLKVGDPIVIHTTFMCSDIDGDIRFNAPSLNGRHFVHFISSKHVSLPSEQEVPTPKYDPTHIFKEGDIVRYVERDGRFYVDAPPVGAICRVIVGEDSVGMVSVEFKFSENEEPAVHDVPFYHLELITPVEELGPYSVQHNEAHAAWSIYGPYHLSAVNYFYGEHYPYTEESAKAAAEAECKRLNEEYRKNQNNE